MSDFLAHYTLATLAELRQSTADTAIENNAPVVPGLYFSWDDQSAKVQVSNTPGAEHLLKVGAQVSGQPRWFTLNFALGQGQLNAQETLGLVLEGAMQGGKPIEIFLRSKIGDTIVDTEWDEHMTLDSENTVVASLSTLPTWSELAGQDAYHTLVMRLPASDFTLTLRDFRIFRVAAGASTRDETVSSWSA